MHAATYISANISHVIHVTLYNMGICQRDRSDVDHAIELGFLMAIPRERERHLHFHSNRQWNVPLLWPSVACACVVDLYNPYFSTGGNPQGVLATLKTFSIV